MKCFFFYGRIQKSFVQNSQANKHLFQWCHDASVKDKKNNKEEHLWMLFWNGFGVFWQNRNLLEHDVAEQTASLVLLLMFWLIFMKIYITSRHAVEEMQNQINKSGMSMFPVVKVPDMHQRRRNEIREPKKNVSLFLISLNKADEDACGRTSNSNLRRPFI